MKKPSGPLDLTQQQPARYLHRSTLLKSRFSLRGRYDY